MSNRPVQWGGQILALGLPHSTEHLQTLPSRPNPFELDRAWCHTDMHLDPPCGLEWAWFVYMMEMNAYNHLILKSTWTGTIMFFPLISQTLMMLCCFFFPYAKYPKIQRTFWIEGYLILRHTHMISQMVRTESQTSFVCLGTIGAFSIWQAP